MADEILLTPSQARKEGHWLPTRHKTAPTLRPSRSRSNSTPARRASFKTVIRRNTLSTITEDHPPSVQSSSTVSLRLNTNLPYLSQSKYECQTPVRSPSSEHLVYFQPSQQLKNFQSVSLHCVGEENEYEDMPRVYRTQSQWAVPSPSPSPGEREIHGPKSPESLTGWSSISPATASGIGQREAVVALMDGSEKGEQEEEESYPKNVRDGKKVWVRVNTVGHWSSRSWRTVGSLRRPGRSFEPRLELRHDVPVHTQLRVYQKPSGVERVRIRLGDSWRELRKWRNGRDDGLLADDQGSQDSKRSEGELRKLARAPGVEGRVIGTRRVRERAKGCEKGRGEGTRRRKESLFLDVYASDILEGCSPRRR